MGAKGEIGPSGTSGYSGTSLDGKVSLSNGIQIWTVPVAGSYVIEARGASGANGTFGSRFTNPKLWKLGGLGAKITGTFQLAQGVKLKILVGQEGCRSSRSVGDQPGGGGGGSFVTLLDNTPLLIAGGGGGGGTSNDFYSYTDGDPGQTTESGTRCGGTQGAGGKVCDENNNTNLRAGAGAGLYGNGGNGMSSGEVPRSFSNGGKGGKSSVANGGFGGGSFSYEFGGGGGGYSGGGITGTFLDGGTAGGGGSYNSGTNKQNVSAVNKGDGKVIITLNT